MNDRDDGVGVLSGFCDELAEAMHATGVRIVERDANGVSWVQGPMWFRPVPMSEAIGAYLAHAVAVRLGRMAP